MKKLILSIAFLAYTINLFAQDDDNTTMGFKLGATLPGTVHGGFIIEKAFHKHMAIVGEVLYNQKDQNSEELIFSDNSGNTIGFFSIKSKHHYAQLPISFKVMFGNKVKPYILGGLAFGYLLSSKTFYPSGMISGYKTNPIEWSYLGAIGVDILPVYIEARFNRSFNYILFEDYGSRKFGYYNQNIMLSVGARF